MDVITETSLEALIQRATDPRNKSSDTAAIDAFCGIIKKEPDGAFIATRLIASKIQSSQEWEALQGLSVLEACMKNCGPSFHSEIGKFRFLNEMIKLVSPKFLGSRTPPPVRNQVLKLMYTWTLSYPKEPKIKEAYDMLKKQGVVSNNELEVSPDESKNSTPQKAHPLFQDEEKVRLLQKLLRSKNREDLQAANRLIKTMVKEDEKRVEIKSRKISELETVRNNVRLLSEMLDSYKPNQVSSEEIELIKELHHSCERLRPIVFRIAADTSDNDELLSQVLDVSDELGHVLNKYNAVMIMGQKPDNFQNLITDSKQISSLLDFTSPTADCVPQIPEEATNCDILNEPLCVLDLALDLPITSNKMSGASNHQIEKTNNTQLDALNDFFAPLNTHTSANLSVSPAKTEEFKGMDKSKLGIQEKKSKIKAFEDLDILGETLMQKCKMDSGLSSRAAEISGDTSAILDKQDKINDVPVSLKNTSETSDDDAMMDLSDVLPIVEQSIPPHPVATENIKQEVKPLTDIAVTIESIKPSSIPPITVIEDKNGISVNLFIARDAPREDVTVLVITTVSKNPSPVSNYLFQAVVPKGCKLKLQSPSGSELPAHSPFLPPSAITQIMLIANPDKVEVTLKCMISFTVDDETITEMGEVERLPTVT